MNKTKCDIKSTKHQKTAKPTAKTKGTKVHQNQKLNKSHKKIQEKTG